MLRKSILLLGLLLSSNALAGAPPTLLCKNADVLARWSSCDFVQAIRGEAGHICFEGEVTAAAKALTEYSYDNYFSYDVYWKFSADKANNKIHVWFDMGLRDIRWSQIIPFCQNF